MFKYLLSIKFSALIIFVGIVVADAHFVAAQNPALSDKYPGYISKTELLTKFDKIVRRPQKFKGEPISIDCFLLSQSAYGGICKILTDKLLEGWHGQIDVGFDNVEDQKMAKNFQNDCNPFKNHACHAVITGTVGVYKDGRAYIVAKTFSWQDNIKDQEYAACFTTTGPCPDPT